MFRSKPSPKGIEKKKETKNPFLNLTTAAKQHHLIPFLDAKSLANAEGCNHFFAKDLFLDVHWKKLVLKEVTSKPKLLQDETKENYKSLYKRAYLLLIKINKALSDPAVTPEVFHDLFKEVVENGFDKYAPLIIDFVNVNKTLNKDDDEEPLWNSNFLHIAAHLGNAELIKVILKKGVRRIDAPGAGFHGYIDTSGSGGIWIKDTGDSALIKAAGSGDLESVALLVRNGANVNFISSSQHNTALHEAADEGHIECVRFLLLKQARVDVLYSKYGTTKELAYELAVNNGHHECAELIATRMKELDIPIPKSLCVIQ